MEEVNTGLNGDIKEKEGQEGGRNVQDGANDLLMVENGDTATAATTLIDFQDSTFASSSHNPPPGNDLQPKTTADDLLFGDGQPSEQTHVYSTLQSSEISSDEPSEILLPSTVVQTEQSEVNRQSESEIMTFSTHKEEKCFEEVWTGEVLEGSLAMGGTETDPHPRDQAGLAEYQLTVMMEQVETQPEEAHMPDIPIDNIEEQTTNQADLDESQPPETAMSNDEPECRANMEVQPEVQEKSQTVLELARDDVETVYHTNDQFTDQFESQPVVQEETHDTGKDNIENVDKQQQSVEQVEPQPAGPEEAKIPETRMDNIQSVYKLDEHSTELVESGPPALNQPDDASIGNVEDVRSADEQFIEEVESIYKPDDHSTELFESGPPAAIDQPQTEDASIDNVEDVCRTDEQFTEEVESKPPALDQPQTEDASIDNVEDVYGTDEQFTKEVESQPPALDQPQTEDASIDNVEDVYRTDEQFTKEVESQPPALDQPQTEDASIDNVEDVCRTDEQFTEEVESEYKPDDHSTELVESQLPALDQPQTEDASIDNVEDVYRTDEQFTEPVKHESAAQEELETPEMPLVSVGDSGVPEEKFTENIELKPAVPEANRFTETIKPNEPEQETVESSVCTEVDKDPSKTTPQAAAVKISTDFKPVNTDSQSSVPKHDKAATQTKTSKTTSAAMKRTKPQSSLAARPQSSKTSKVKTSATSSQTSITTKKPSGAKSRQVSTAPSKAAPAKPQGSSKPFSTSTKQHVAAKKSATTSNAPFARQTPTATSTRPAMSSKTAATSSKSATTRSKPATTSSKPATTSSKPATTSSKPTTTSSKHTTTSSKPATTDSGPASSARPGVTKDKRSTKPPSAPNANTKTTLSKTRPQSGKPTSAKPADKTDGKVPNSLRKVNGKSASSGSSKTAVKQTTVVATSTQGPKTTKTTRNVTTTTVKETKTSIQHQSKAGGALKPGSATGAKPKASGASARPKSPTKQSSKKTTTTKTEKPVAAAEPPCNAADNSASQEVTTESDVTTTVLERTFTEDGDETTMREVTETVSTNAEQEAIVAETVVDKSE